MAPKTDYNYSALKDNIDGLLEWKKDSQKSEVERAKTEGRTDEAIETLKGVQQDLWDALNGIKDAKKAHVEGDGRRGLKIAGGAALLIATFEFVKWLVSLLVSLLMT